MRTQPILLITFVSLAGCILDDDLGELDSTTAALEDHFGSRGQNELESSRWNGWFCINDETCAVGDFDGDGRDDVVTFLNNGTTYVALSTGSSFESAGIWDRDFCNANRVCTTGNVNGDAFDDIIAFDQSNGRVYVALSTGSSFGVRRTWHTSFCNSDSQCDVGDFNGDGHDDIIEFHADARVRVALSNGTTRFQPSPSQWHGSIASAGHTPRIGDLNADGRDDIAVFEQATGRVHVAMSIRDEDRFGNRELALTDFCPADAVCDIADVDGDGAGDLITFMRSAGYRDPYSGINTNGDVYVSLARPRALFGQSETDFGTPRIRHGWFCIGQEVCGTGDFNGDGYGDVVTFLRSTSSTAGRGDVYVGLSNFGRTKSWRLKVEDLYMVKPEDSGGDEPYLIMLSYRVRLGERGSTEIWLNSYRSASVTGLGAGQRRVLPPSMGETTFADLELPTVASLMRTGDLPELFGAVLIAVDSDGSSWGIIDDLVRRVQAELYAVLEDEAEDLSVLAFANRGTLRDTMTKVRQRLRDSLQLTLLQVLNLWASSFGDPDDIIGYHTVAALAMDKDTTDSLSFSRGRHTTLGVIGEGDQTNGSHNVFFFGDNPRVDDDVKYRARLTFTPID
jgi:hypothetical protein